MSGNRRRFVGRLFVLSALLSAPSSALAQPAPAQPATDAARADALFQEGKVLMEQSRFDEACARLAQSDAIDPTVSTIGLLAGCHEQQGRIATAWREYQVTVKRAEAASDNRADFARERAAALEPLLPKLLIRLVSPSPDVEILRNLERVPAAELGVEVPVDPGAYEIVARAPRRQEMRMTITAREGAKVIVDVPDLKGASADVMAAPAARPPPSVSAPMKATMQRKPRPKAPPAEEAGTSDKTRLSAAAVAGVVGVAGLGIGAMFGISAVSKSNESTIIRATCQGAECDKGRELREGAYSASTASTVSFAVGAVGLGVGLVLLLLPSSKATDAEARSGRVVRIAPVASRDGGGAAVVGRF